MVRRAFLALFALAVICLAPATSDAQTKRVALLIGNADYKNTERLLTPINDVNDLTVLLKSAGFSVVTIIDADAMQMRVALADFAERAKSSELALVFYAGHAIEFGDENRLLAVDAKVDSKPVSPVAGIALRDILKRLNEAGSPALVIVNAGRQNPFSRSGVIAPISSESFPNQIVAFSTGPGSKSIDGDARNSPFAVALLKHLAIPGVPIEQLLRPVREQVMEITKGRQIPWTHSSMIRDLILVPAR
ncbi:MAG: caspase family protein [Pseudorhodoplanes sp.]